MSSINFQALNLAANLIVKNGEEITVNTLVEMTGEAVEDCTTFVSAMNTASEKPSEKVFKASDSFEGCEVRTYTESNGATESKYAEIVKAIASRNMETLMSIDQRLLAEYNMAKALGTIKEEKGDLILNVRTNSKGEKECAVKGVKGRPTVVKPFVQSIFLAMDVEGLVTNEASVKAYNDSVGIGMPTIHSLAHFRALVRAFQE